MRSLASKLTLGFLAIGALGALLVVLTTTVRVRRQLNTFLDTRSGEAIVGQLSAFYSARGEWQGVDQFIAGAPALAPRAPLMLVLDADDRVVFRPLSGPAADLALDSAAFDRLALSSDGTPAGTLLLLSAETVRDTPGPPPPEARFLRDLTFSAMLSAAMAGAAALGAGYLLARALTRPIRELTVAAQRMAAGALGTQVAVQGRDEISRLARAFNAMSRDLATARDRRKQMTADIAHDLRTPLTVLHGYTEGLKEGELTGEPRLYGIMYDEVVQLERLVGDLRTLSLADAGELSLARRAVDVAALLERSALAAVVRAEARGIALRVEAPDNLPPVYADPARLTQVLDNLVSNALRHTAAGEIVLSAAWEESAVVLRVRDSGTGIDTADLPHIFDRFYRGDKSRQRDPQSASGLGLAIAQAIVEAHGGTISAESQVGVGTAFTICLPTMAG